MLCSHMEGWMFTVLIDLWLKHPSVIWETRIYNLDESYQTLKKGYLFLI